jgi:hypothetical protein
MARGFESKDIEFQQAEAERRAAENRPQSGEGEQRARSERCATIRLSLANARANLRAAKSPAHTQMLEAAIESLQAELDSIDPGSR